MATFTTSKGETFESPYTDEQAAKVLAVAGKGDFAKDLVAAFSRGRITLRQRSWLHKLAVDAGTPKPQAKQEPTCFGLTGVVTLLYRAAAHLKFPKLTLDRDGQLLRLSIAGPKSKYAGSIMVTDGKVFPNNIWFGTIAEDGSFTPSRSATTFVIDSLVQLNADPAGFARRYGKDTGSCCFCSRELSTPESLAVGYGPVCAEHYGLPWGDKDLL